VLPTSARTGRSPERAPDGGAGRRTSVPGPLCGIALPGRCAPSPSPALQTAVLLIAGRQEPQARGADLGPVCVRTSACSCAHARRRRASGTANRSADGTARTARRCQEPCGRCEVLSMPNTCRNHVPGFSTAYICAGQRTIECGQPDRLQDGRSTRSLPNRTTTFHPIGLGRRPAHGWRRICLPPGSRGMLLISVRVSFMFVRGESANGHVMSWIR
jgi:hypothetical protein